MKTPTYPTTCVERFLRYVTVDTQSREGSDTFPSTPGQLTLLRQLVDELTEIGLPEVTMDEHGYVFATLAATTRKTGVPTIGFIAHVDTSPEMSGAGVRPVVHRNWNGEDIVFPEDPEVVLRLADDPHLAEQIGHDIITASGATLLGADNKAGVAEIVGAAEYMMGHPEILHGRIRLGFTPDEEIGAGTKHFDVERFGAKYAYTLDGETLGQIESESFSADSMVLRFLGRNTHPGFAKGRMINAIKLAAAFIERLPKDSLSPETTEGYEGYVHPYVLEASVDRTVVRTLVRDFRTAGLAEKQRTLAELAREVVAGHPGARVEIEVLEYYRNMREVLDGHPEVTQVAREAIRRAGLEVREKPIRGGTDGSRLSFMGLPTPNLFAGEHNFHSRTEWVSAQDMHKAVEVMIETCRLWEERSG